MTRLPPILFLLILPLFSNNKASYVKNIFYGNKIHSSINIITTVVSLVFVILRFFADIQALYFNCILIHLFCFFTFLILVFTSVLNDTLRIVTGCLRPTPTDHLPVLSGIQPAELRRPGATLSLAYRGSLDPDHILYGLLSGSSDTFQVRLRSRRPFVPAARNLLDNLTRLGIRASEWTNHKWNTEYCKNPSRFRAFVSGTGARPVGMGLPRAAWVKLNRLRTGVGRFHSSMHNWGLAPSPNCEYIASEQTADHVLTACSIHRAPHGARGLTVLDDETRCWLNNTTASI